MHQQVSEITLPQDEDALMAMITSASIELARFAPQTRKHILTEEGLDIMRKVLFDVRNRSFIKRLRNEGGLAR